MQFLSQMKKMRNKKVLVTGGAGFIGSNLVERLVKDGHNVKIIDNLSTGKIENLRSVIYKIEFIEGDITNEEHIMKAADGVDYIFHQAALVSVQRSVENPRKTLLANSLGTLNVLDAARKNKVKKVIYASSSSIYGERKDREKKEIMKPQPLSTYAASKLDGEHQCKVFSHVHELPTICLRYFNVFGPKQNPHSEYSAVIPRFISLMLNDKKPVIFGDGTQTRDLLYVDDCARFKAKISLIKKPIPGITKKKDKGTNIFNGLKYITVRMIS